MPAKRPRELFGLASMNGDLDRSICDACWRFHEDPCVVFSMGNMMGGRDCDCPCDSDIGAWQGHLPPLWIRDIVGGEYHH